jgi:hypothetical protein
MCEFLPLYKLLCRARRAFKRQDHHWNGQIDRCGRRCTCTHGWAVANHDVMAQGSW